MKERGVDSYLSQGAGLHTAKYQSDKTIRYQDNQSFVWDKSERRDLLVPPPPPPSI